MRTRTALASLAVFAAAALCFAADPNMGTWKLNEAKSKFSPGATKNTTVIYAPSGEMVKVTTVGNRDGKAVTTEWTGRFDGKDYPVKGDPTSDTRAYKVVDDHTLDLTAKKDGKVTLTGKIVVAADGKSRTVTTAGVDPKAPMANVSVYDKQ